MHHKRNATVSMDYLEKRLKRFEDKKFINRKLSDKMSLMGPISTTNYYSSTNQHTTENGNSRNYSKMFKTYNNKEYKENIEEFFLKKIKFPKEKKMKKIDNTFSFKYYTVLPSKMKNVFKYTTKNEKIREKGRYNILQLNLEHFEDIVNKVNKRIENSLIKRRINSMKFTIPLLPIKSNEHIKYKLRECKTNREYRSNLHNQPIHREDKYTSINSRISFPYLINDNKLLSEIYNKNLNYQKHIFKNINHN